MYDVRWSARATEKLAELWNDGDSTLRTYLTHAATEIDRQLARDAENCGESRPKGRRVLFVWPLGVLFRILPDNRTARILKIWNY
jgi:plasmid stabilization system protein ParE